MVLKMRVQSHRLTWGNASLVIAFYMLLVFKVWLSKDKKYFRALGGYHNIYKFLFAIFRIYAYIL